MVHRVAEYSQSRLDSKFQLSSARLGKTDIPKLFAVDTFERVGCKRVAGTGRVVESTSRERERKRERERESFTARVSNPASRCQQHSTVRKRRCKVYAVRVARVLD